MKKLFFVFAVFSLLCLSITGYARTITVHPGQSIQNAINSANEGDTVLINAGIHRISETLLVNEKKGIKIMGVGRNIIILNNLNATVLNVNQSTDITIEGLRLTHIPEGRSEGCGIDGLVLSVSGNQITVRKCELDGCGTVGIMMNNIKKLLVEDCVFFNNSIYGILSYSGAEDVTINRNTFRNNKEVSALVNIQNAKNIKFTNNLVTNNKTGLINLTGIQGLELTGNRFINNPKGVVIRQSTGVTVERNTFSGVPGRTVDIEQPATETSRPQNNSQNNTGNSWGNDNRNSGGDSGRLD